MIRRLAGTVIRPRSTFAELVRQPAWVTTWLVILIIWAAVGGALMGTGVGRQALVDERVRVIETFGGTVSDAMYAALQAQPPWWIYFASGGRVLLTPAVTVIVAFGLWLICRGERAAATMTQTLAIAVHASVVLLIGQCVATPLHYIRESLTSPLNLAAVLPLMEEGTVPARFFGTLDFFALWWLALLALGLAALTGRRPTRYIWPLVALYVGFAAVVAAFIAAAGGA